MSSHIFAELTRSDPSLEYAANVLDSWLDHQVEESPNEVHLSWITKELSSKITGPELARVVNLLSKSPRVKIVYRIMDPEGNLGSKEFELIQAIPRSSYDQSGNPFDVELSNVEQVIQFR